MIETPPTALTIAGSDSGGGAGLAADLKTFFTCGVHGLAAITAVTAQNTRGVTGVWDLPAEAVRAQLDAVATDIGIGAAKTGMLATADIVHCVADTVARWGIDRFVLDPVCASQHGSPLLSDEALAAVRDRLFPVALLATPNVHEVRLLTGVEIRRREDMRAAASALLSFGARWVLVKGGHLTGDQAVDLLTDGTVEIELAAPRDSTRHLHGSGDSLAAATTAALARGFELIDAVRFGKRFVTRAVAGAYPLGSGTGPVGHFWRLAGDDA